MSYRSRFGRVNYSRIQYDDENVNWCYSAKKLENEVNAKCTGQKITKIYVGLEGYLESLHWDERHYDFSYMGGPLLVIFEKVALLLYIHAEGMFQYKFLDIWEIKIRTVHDYVPDNFGLAGDDCFYDLNNQFYIKYEDSVASEIEVTTTGDYPFCLHSFNEEKAEIAMKNNDLPSKIIFYLDNNVKIIVAGSDLEYFDMELDTHNRWELVKNV